MNPFEERLSELIRSVGDLTKDVVEADGWDEAMHCAYMVDQLEEACNRLEKARELLREA